MLLTTENTLYKKIKILYTFNKANKEQGRRLKMISFKNDYSEGALPYVMEALLKTNMEQTVGYGDDEYTAEAIATIKEKIKCDDCYIRLLVGGTQTNLLTIAHSLRPHEAVIAPTTGHISVHEAGAIEATGHKVIEIPTENGKLDVESVRKMVELHMDFHMVQPKMVYISNPTEIGTIYSKEELKSLSDYCKEAGLYLYLDGARMASALTSEKNDIAIEDYAKYTDAFYLGGTKCGLLFGEALVLINKELRQHNFIHITKQRGATLAKGRLLGVQFKELFTGNRYEEVGKHSNEMAMMIKRACLAQNIELKTDSYTNQQFPILPNIMIDELGKKYRYEFWEKVDDKTSVIRFVTSWATKKEDVEELIKDIEVLSKKYL